MISVVPKGRHSGFRFPKRIKGDLTYRVRFNDSARYEHGDLDQYDWNKLFGVKKRFFSPMQNSIMKGWRYNVKTKLIEIVDYSHFEGIRFIGEVITKVKVGEWILLTVKNEFECAWLILNWFGGQKCSPNRLTIEFERV